MTKVGTQDSDQYATECTKMIKVGTQDSDQYATECTNNKAKVTD
jgi:hypothetical protein